MVHGLSRHATQRMVKSICDWIPPSGTRHHPRFAMVHTPVLIVVLFSCISLCLSLRLRMSETRPSWTLLPSSVSLPNAMYSNRPGTWAHDTMSRRVHEDILPRIIDDNADLLGGSIAFYMELHASVTSHPSRRMTSHVYIIAHTHACNRSAG